MVIVEGVDIEALVEANAELSNLNLNLDEDADKAEEGQIKGRDE